MDHSTADLCRCAGQRDADFSTLLAVAAPLDKHHVPTRYPDGLPGGIPADAFTRQDAEQALAQAEEVLRVVAGKLRARGIVLPARL